LLLNSWDYKCKLLVPDLWVVFLLLGCKCFVLFCEYILDTFLIRPDLCVVLGIKPWTSHMLYY
jgi:hypothetical protein